MIIIITGAPGTGKSKTAKLLLESTNNSAHIEGDFALATNPSDRSLQKHLRYKNIASLANNYIEEGYSQIFVSFVYARNEDLEEQTKLFNGNENIKTIALITKPEILNQRHINDDYERVGINESTVINNMIAKLNDIKIIDNSNLTIQETVDKIKNLISSE